MRAARPGLSELAVAAAMGYAGEPLSCHVMCTGGRGEIVGLRSPTARPFAAGDGVSAAVGYWGGLCARAGLLAADDDLFLQRLARPYFGAIATWYATIGVGVAGGTIHERIAAALADAGVRSALNPGHLGGLEEWINSPIRPESTDRLASGMLVQCDIIPTPTPPGWTINGEDPIVLADAATRDDLAQRFPAVWARMVARRRFMRDELGLAIGDDVLPLSTMPGYLAPLWLSPSRVLTVT